MQLTTEEIEEIRSALRVIKRDAKGIQYSHSVSRRVITTDIIQQVKRIDKLLPKEQPR